MKPAQPYKTASIAYLQPAPRRRWMMQLVVAALAWRGSPLHAAGQPAAQAGSSVADESWIDAARQRSVQVRVRAPAGTERCGLVLYSHGLGGDLDAGAAWGQAWSDAGFIVVHMQHAGSDRAVARQGMAAMREAASAQQAIERVRDARFVLAEIAARRLQSAQALWQRVMPDAIGMAGHSFGSHTTLALAGAAGAAGAAGRAEQAGAMDFRAFIALSPAPARRGGGSLAQQFGNITRPVLCMTGTLDGDPLSAAAQRVDTQQREGRFERGRERADEGGRTQARAGARESRAITPQDRRSVYEGLPAGQRALLVLQDADHATFAGTAARTGLARQRDAAGAARPEAALQALARHQALVASISTDWWRYRLLGDAAAARRLQAPAGLLAGDEWLQG